MKTLEERKESARKAFREWRKSHTEQRNIYRKRNYNKTSYARNHRKPWTEEEDFLVFNSKLTDFELSKQIGRSVQAIQIRRCRLNK